MKTFLCAIIVGLIISNMRACNRAAYYKKSLLIQIPLIDKLYKRVGDFYEDYSELVEQAGEKYGGQNEVSNDLQEDTEEVTE